MPRKHSQNPFMKHRKLIFKEVRPISDQLFIACKGILEKGIFLHCNCQKDISKNPTILLKYESSGSESTYLHQIDS